MKFLSGLVSFIFIVAILGAAALGGAWLWMDNEVSKAGPTASETVFTVKPGEGIASVAARLEAEGLIANKTALRLKARIDGTENAIKVGEYSIPARISAAAILDQLIEGKVVSYKITLPEGLTTAQILRIVAADANLMGDMPETVPAEGELLPDTYLFETGTSRADMLTRLASEQDKLIAELWPTRDKNIPLKTQEEAINLASIVQKEAAGHEEYGRVASVFINRLNQNIPLQTDPTVHYGVNEGEPLINSRGQRRTLLRSELDRDTPWNTYTRPGLPATPISNPGRDAIKAVLNPPETEFLFFVADGKGGTTFSRNLAEHNRAVAAYRKYEREEIARERAND